MKRDGEAVLQSLTAVWRRMRHLRECDEKGNDLEEVERVVRKGLCYGSTAFGVVVLVMVDAAGDASRHAAVSDCRTVSPSCLAECPSDAG